MKALVIIAHPEGGGHNRYLLEQTTRHLKERKVDFQIIDLYKEKFDPNLQFKPSKKQAAQVKKYQKMIDEATHIIMHYPIWWNGMPAILKGFMDQVLEAGFAFKFKATPIPNVGIPEGLLSGRAVTITTGGAPGYLFRLFQLGRGDKAARVDCLIYCGIKTKNFHLGAAQNLEKNKQKMDVLANKAINWLLPR